jgi:hypothetical protein
MTRNRWRGSLKRRRSLSSVVKRKHRRLNSDALADERERVGLVADPRLTIVLAPSFGGAFFMGTNSSGAVGNCVSAARVART